MAISMNTCFYVLISQPNVAPASYTFMHPTKSFVITHFFSLHWFVLLTLGENNTSSERKLEETNGFFKKSIKFNRFSCLYTVIAHSKLKDNLNVMKVDLAFFHQK